MAGAPGYVRNLGEMEGVWNLRVPGNAASGSNSALRRYMAGAGGMDRVDISDWRSLGRMTSAARSISATIYSPAPLVLPPGGVQADSIRRRSVPVALAAPLVPHRSARTTTGCAQPASQRLKPSLLLMLTTVRL